MSTLVIIPCGKAKVWDNDPYAGTVAAKDAYTGGPFKVNRGYAEATGSRWIILSAKYGFIEPDFPIPESYNVTFKKRSTRPILLADLRSQRERLELGRYERVVVLGGVEYRQAVMDAFAGTQSRVESPFAGLPLGPMLSATKKATEEMLR